MTIEQLDDAMLRNYTELELQKIEYTLISDSDKQVYINKCVDLLYTLKWRGQPLKEDSIFPRLIRDEVVEEPAVFHTCVALLTYELILRGKSKRLALQSEGVSEIKVDKLTEKFSEPTDKKSHINLINNKGIKERLDRFLIKSMFNR